jgi:hypothetical protein
MTNDPTSDPAEQAAHRPCVIVGELPDGCRSLVFSHFSHDDWIRVVRAVRSAGIAIPDQLEANMHRLGEIGDGGRTPIDLQAHLDVLHRTFDTLKPRRAPRRPTHQECCGEAGEDYENSKQLLKRRGTSWRRETREW